MKKETIIIVHGANYLKSKSKVLEFCIVQFYKLFNAVPRYKCNDAWLPRIKNNKREVISLVWSGEIPPLEIEKAVDSLLKLISSKKEVTIVSCSLGTQIALNALKKTNKIRKIVSISGVYRKTNTNINFIDIRSNTDYFANFFRFLMSTFAFSKMNRRVIVLNSIRHDEFHDNKKLDGFNGKKLSDLINSCL